VFEFVEEPFENLPFFVKLRTNFRQMDPGRYQPDIAQRYFLGRVFAQPVAGVSPVRQQYLTPAQRAKHIRR